MKKREHDMLPEYDFRGGVRGKYARDFGRNRNLRVLAPDLLATFPDSESVNEALRTLVRLGGCAVEAKRPHSLGSQAQKEAWLTLTS